MTPNNRLLLELSKYLAAYGLSSRSVVMYKSDVRLFLDWVCQTKLANYLSLTDELLRSYITADSFTEYINYLGLIGTTDKTLRRKFASLKHFGFFLFKEANPLRDITTQQILPKNVLVSINQYTKVLKKANASNKTIVNYKSDINQFLSWMKNDYNPKEGDILGQFILYLNQNFSKSSVRRKYYSISKYISYINRNTAKRKNSIYSANKQAYKPVSRYTLGFLATIIVLIFTLAGTYNQIYLPEELTKSTNDQKISLLDNVTSKKFSTSEIGFNETKGLKIVLDNQNNQFSPDIKIFKVALNSTDFTEFDDIALYEQSMSSKSGKSTIRHGDTEVLISNNRINKESLIFVTPTVSTRGQEIYVKEVANGQAIISINTPLDDDIIFNWFIDDNQIYHSIL